MAKCSVTSTKHTIRITIEKVSEIPSNTMVISPDFYLTPKCMCCTSFKISESNLYVFICNKSATEIEIETTIILFDCNYKKLYEENDAKTFSLKKDKDVDVIGRVHGTRRFKTLINDTLIIYICVSIKETATKEKYQYLCKIDHDRKLKDDFMTMLEIPVNSDVSLQVGKEKIPAHWSVLCSRCPYFKKMYDSGMKERVQNSVTITDLSPGTAKKLIQFLYTADIKEEDDLQELFDLYRASDRYELMDLRILCASKIISKVTTDNAGEILQLSYGHNDKDLRMEAMDFIQSHSDAVFQTEGWKGFEASEPAISEVIVFLCLKKN